MGRRETCHIRGEFQHPWKEEGWWPARLRGIQTQIWRSGGQTEVPGGPHQAQGCGVQPQKSLDQAQPQPAAHLLAHFDISIQTQPLSYQPHVLPYLRKSDLLPLFSRCSKELSRCSSLVEKLMLLEILREFRNVCFEVYNWIRSLWHNRKVGLCNLSLWLSPQSQRVKTGWGDQYSVFCSTNRFWGRVTSFPLGHRTQSRHFTNTPYMYMLICDKKLNKKMTLIEYKPSCVPA